MRTITEFTPSRSALAAAAALGRRMARQDTWIEPVFEDHNNYLDYGQFSEQHRDGWNATDQFNIRWRTKVNVIVDAQAKRFENRDDFNTEERYEYIYLPLHNAMWDAWEEAVRLFDKWKKEAARRYRRRRRHATRPVRHRDRSGPRRCR